MQHSSSMTQIAAPTAQRHHRDISSASSGRSMLDPYHWLRDDTRSSPVVLQYLKDENSYAEHYLEALDPLIDSLVSDVDQHLPAVELSLHSLQGGYIYYHKRAAGEGYWTLYRRHLQQQPAAASNASNTGTMTADEALTADKQHVVVTQSFAEAVQQAVAEAVSAANAGADASCQFLSINSSSHLATGASSSQSQEQIVLDENLLAQNHTYWDVSSFEVSSDGRLVAFAVDTVGNESYDLQVLDIATQQPLLAAAVPGCAGQLVWWGNSSDTLLYVAEDMSATDRSKLLVKVLRLQQQQPEQQQQAQHTQQPAYGTSSGVIYKPSAEETELSIKMTHDKQFILLTSRLGGATQVQALATSYPINLTAYPTNSDSANVQTKNSSSTRVSSAANSLIVPHAAWELIVSAEDDVDVLACEHLDPPCSSSGSSQTISRANPGGLFLALIDDDNTPDGELVLIDARSYSGGQLLAPGQAPVMDVLVPNRSSHSTDGIATAGSTGDSDTPAAAICSCSCSDGEQSSSNRAAIPQQQPVQHQQQQQQFRWQQQQHPLELTDFAVHAATGYMAVAVRNDGTCQVRVYQLHMQQSAAAAVGNATAAAAAQGNPPTVVLRISATSNSVGDHHFDCIPAANTSRIATAATASSSTTSRCNKVSTSADTCSKVTAGHAWTVVADDATALMSLQGFVGPADDPWMAVDVSSITVPSTLYYVHLHSRQQLKVYQEVINHYQPDSYVSHLEWATSKDGTAVPVTVAYHKDMLRRDGSTGAILRGYGAYGSKQWPSFNPADLTLLDKGLVLAIAHVRGGGELGSAWHIQGKKLSKKNTFWDFLAAAQHLVAAGYTSRERLAVWGRSAGGLTVGASLNLDPGFARVAVMDVPFLDVLNTMMDPDLPLTIKERSEWGDPLDSQEVHNYIQSYTPYLNLQAGTTYPALLLTASLHDTRVNCWEPAKYVAAMRHLQKQQQHWQEQGQQQSQPNISTQQKQKQQSTTNLAQQEQHENPAHHGQQAAGPASAAARPVLLLTDMHAGHFATSAASSRLREWARKVAFILHTLGSTCK